jgi:hypothetical protein
MGQMLFTALTSFLDSLSGLREKRILLLGLDASGKCLSNKEQRFGSMNEQ